MILLWLILCVTSFVDTQINDEAAVLERDLQEFVRRLTEQQMQTTRNAHSSFLPQLNPPSLQPQRNEKPTPSLSAQNFPFQSTNAGGRAGSSSFGSSFASVKRPYEEEVSDSKAVAFASVRDVNGEEHLGEDIGDSSEKSTSAKESQRTTTKSEDAYGTSSGKSAPFTLKHQQVETVIRKDDDSFSDVYFVAIVSGCCAIGIFGVISAGFCFYRLQKSRKAAADVDYPAYGVTGPCKDVTSPNVDRKLAQSAQMYHYQHQKQQMIAVEKAGSTKNTSASDVDSEEENEEGDYTVYECPGLAPAGEMEVKNPLFHDDSTPVSPPVHPAKSDSLQSN